MRITNTASRAGRPLRLHGRVVTWCTPVALLGGLAAAQEFAISRWTIDGGGVVQSQGGGFELSGTIGQPDAGVMSGGSFDLSGGFWFGVGLTDCDDDGFVNLADMADFVHCMSGPGPAPSYACRCFDVNQSGRVDLADFASAQAGFYAN